MITVLQKMVSSHGLKNGLRRFSEEVLENRVFDILHGVDTAGVVTHTEYFDMIGAAEDSGPMWYQPTYTSVLKKAFVYLNENHFEESKQTLFIDLGTGKGKPCILAAKIFNNCKVIGVDLAESLLQICENNLSKIGADFQLLHTDVLKLDFADLIQGYDQIVIHNKNSFDETITGQVLENLKQQKGNKTVYYVYNNPVYGHLFDSCECIFELKGWHKNLNLKLYSL